MVAIMSEAMELQQSRLKELFKYDSLTGILSRRINKAMAKAGDHVGSISNDGYLEASVDCKLYKVHRLIWLYVNGEMPNIIDHINRNRLDNSILNLRNVDRLSNQRNSKIPKTNTSGFPGVSWCKANKNWRVQLSVNNKSKAIGRFDNIIDAVAACIRARKDHGFHENHCRNI